MHDLIKLAMTTYDMKFNDVLTLSVAIYAAVVSSFVFGWDFYKWFVSGPKVRVTIKTGCKFLTVEHGVEVRDPKTYIVLDVINVGDRATTITGLRVDYYTNWWSAASGRLPKDNRYIVKPSRTKPLPYRLESGDQWIGKAEQDADVINMLAHGFLFFVICDAHGGRHRVRARLTTKDQAA